MFRTLFAVATLSATLVTPAFAEDQLEAISNQSAEQAATASAIADKMVADIKKDDILTFLIIPETAERAELAVNSAEDVTLLVSVEDDNSAG